MLLIECHGAGETKRNDIEISSGSNSLIKAVVFGRLLAETTKYKYRIAAQITAGSSNLKTIVENHETFSTLSLPALKTKSLTFACKLGVPALYIEAKPKIRISEFSDRSIPPDGVRLGSAIANIINNS